MHRCLYINEIVELIAFELVADRGRATAVALACCCKNFEDPALDALWATQDKLMPLLKTLPDDIWGHDSGHNSYQRLPTTQEWTRFRKHARNMQEVRGESIPGNISLQFSSILQSFASSKPLLPNLKALQLWGSHGSLISFTPFILSPKTTTIHLTILNLEPHKAAAASMITTLSALCPNLQEITLYYLPRDPIITAAVSELVLTANRDTLRTFNVDSPLTEEAREVVCELPGLYELQVVVDGPYSLPTMMLPNLSQVEIKYNHNYDWLQGFREAPLNDLDSIIIHSESEPIGDFLETFKSIALTTSIPDTLSRFTFYTYHQWRPSYSSLLPFTQMQHLTIWFSCYHQSCSSTIDDDMITELAQTMPELQYLHIGRSPCDIPGGITVKGLYALAHHCPDLDNLCIHFQLATLNPSEIHKLASTNEYNVLPNDCALHTLFGGFIPVPKESASTVASALLLLFPHLCGGMLYLDNEWEAVDAAMKEIKRSADRSGLLA